jgi:hypothetical protein
MNICQNLWNQFAKVDAAQKSSAEAFDVADKEGKEHVITAQNALLVLDAELQTMQEAWDGSYVTLLDGRRLFGPEFEALQRLIDKFERNNNSQEYFYEEMIKISDEGHLTRIGLADITLTDLNDLRYFTQLDNFFVDDLTNKDISPLKNLKKLKRLYLVYDGMTDDDMKIISDFKELQLLSLSSKRITGISQLENLHNLNELYIHDTSVRDIQIVSKLSNLKLLDISGTNVIDISCLAKLPSLDTLYLASVKIEDYLVLLHLPNLNFVVVDYKIIANPNHRATFDELKKRGVSVITT